MTQDYSKLTDREIDALVAEQVMGLRVTRDGYGDDPRAWEWGKSVGGNSELLHRRQHRAAGAEPDRGVGVRNALSASAWNNDELMGVCASHPTCSV